MGKRKTFSIEEFKKKVNGILLNTEDSSKSAREQSIVLLEDILLGTGNYEGFVYLSPQDMLESENGLSFGVDTNTVSEDIFDNTDHTRVKYL